MKKALFLGEDAPREAVEALFDEGFDVRILRKSPRLPSNIASHADMLLLPFCGGLLCGCETYEENRGILWDIPCTLSQSEPGGAYPDDVLLNAFYAAGAWFGREASLCPELKEYCRTNNIPIINVRQGYAKCSTLIMEKGAVTADRGIAAALEGVGREVLLISPGGIELVGCDYGFIGGASIYWGKKAYFFGEIKSHPDGDAIIEYCEKLGVEAVSLCKGPLKDVGGGVIPAF